MTLCPLASGAVPVLLSLSLAMAGCELFERPAAREFGDEVAVPSAWSEASEGTDGDVAPGWLASFGDERMAALVEEAIVQNRDLRAAAARLAAVRESPVIARSARLPVITASGSAAGSGARTRDDSGNLLPWANGEDYGLAINISWELDLWGRLAHLDRAASLDVEASAADYYAARLSLAANAAKAWCSLIAAEQQLDLAYKTRDLFERNFRITERNYRAGDLTASPLDVQFGRNNIASAERTVIFRELARDDAKRGLEILLGRYPAAAIDSRAELPALPSAVPAGLPADLLLRRPDLRAAAADLLASAERVDASRKALLPSIDLSARGSVASEKLLDLVADPTVIARSVAASLSQPIFRGGALRARVRQDVAFSEAALEQFASAALRAFREVESALARESSLAREEEFLDAELAQAELAEAQASRDYSEGIVGILSVLEAQRRAFSARSAMISLRNQRLQNRLDLHLALGGDFRVASEDLPFTEAPVSTDS